MATPPFDANSWEFLQRIIRVNHNREVRSYFKDAEGEDSVRTGRLALKTALTIKDNDSAIEVINKQVYFNELKRQYSSDSFITYPEDYQVRKEIGRPQLVVIFVPTKEGLTNKQYPITIPHYKGDKKPKIKQYYKGKNWARLILKDNSHLRINARSKAEAISMIKHLLNYVEPKYRTDTKEIITGHYETDRFKVLKMRPYRADYYPQGKQTKYSTWQYYL